jgi:hypothetical protein
MTIPGEPRSGEPSVLARLAAQQERRFVRRRPSRTARVVGWLLIVAIAILIVDAAIEVHPW